VSGRKHRWLRRAVASLVVIVVLVVGGSLLFLDFFLGPAPAPLALTTPVAASGGSPSTIDGTWTAGVGSLAGYRVRASILGQGGDVVGRSSAVSGQVMISGDDAVSGTLSVDLTKLQQDGKAQPQLAQILATGAYPDATFTLSTPIVPASRPVIGEPFTVRATGMLTMHGSTQTIVAAITARWDGSSLEATGSIPVVFADWKVTTPWGLEDHGSIEFLLVLHQ